ncbi:alpha-amylase family glycosyl hydrolase [Marinitoga sp. 1155]|uniref:alpha-amylase family glycosyl hydrolase n=1 Tax=Marinitoga sp. 1155 TaxID=1428448 RepID=UPI000640FFC1|nr:alpha-amylase family glycosyl hydrolase [Marinitoga sp. 1155]KLO20936.1 alpha-amylase [Marinitoga sp. 1155]
MRKSFLFISFLILFGITYANSFNWEDQVIYFVMIDRFANGDFSNDVLTKNGIEAGFENSKYNGGDLKGIISKLDYIKNLGATAIWITPPVANQWWDGYVNYGGYHGYWARDFKKVDEHFGDIEIYKKLVDEAHKRGLYVIQDIVTNHVGNFFIYKDGKYFLNDKSIPTKKPIQYPFDMNDYNDPEQRRMNIYHFPTEIKNPDKQNTEFANLDDLNTENPIVIDALKDSYNFWIKKVGIDGFRIDTAIYVPHEFWKKFLNDKDGIYSTAKKEGKDNFIVFGEAWITPPPFDNTGEKTLKEYFDDGYNSMLDFPLLTGIKRVFKEGKPTSYLAFRLKERQQYYDSKRLVTFVDNHDMDRFLKGATKNDLKQALTLIFTIPGIPTIYYGTEQGFEETRATMFKGGFASKGVDHFDIENDLYKFIQTLTKLRKENTVFRYGKVDVVFADEIGPGVLAYTISNNNEKYLVMINTNAKRKYATGIDLGLKKGIVLKNIFALNMLGKDIVYKGTLNTLMNGKAVAIYRITNEIKSVKKKDTYVKIINIESGSSYKTDFVIKGIANNAKSIKLIIDGEEKEYVTLNLNKRENEKWQIPVKISEFTPGKHKIFVKAYGKIPIINAYSKTYEINIDIPSKDLAYVEDRLEDDFGPFGTYKYPLDTTFKNQADIKAVKIQQIGTQLKVDLIMKEVTDSWSPANGFDHVTFQIFFDNPDKEGIKVLPQQNAKMPDNLDWDYELYLTGWIVSVHSSEGANKDTMGKPITPVPTIKVNKQLATISFTIPLSVLETDNLSGWKIYITTYDYDGIESVLRPLTPEGGQWAFGGGQPTDPKIMDDILIKIN